MYVGTLERLGASLIRAPFVWLVATITLFLFFSTGLAAVAEQGDRASSALALVGAGMIAFSVGAWGLASRVDDRGPASVAILVRWVFAACPFLFAFCAVGAGAKQWVFSLGFLTSVVLLAITVRDARRV